MGSKALEIAVQDLHGVAAARSAGADRIELCSALAVGGLTPSAGLIQAAVAEGIAVQVLVRPRAGGFEYSAAEIAVILNDVRWALDLGAAGVVVGATIDAMVNVDVVARVRELAGEAEVTFHRAFDVIADQQGALEQLVGLGVDRILTSGGATRAPDALERLQSLTQWAAGRIQVMAGSGIDSTSAAAVAATGVDAIHSSAKQTMSETLPVGLGSRAGAGETTWETTSEVEVRAMRRVLDGSGDELRPLRAAQYPHV